MLDVADRDAFQSWLVDNLGSLGIVDSSAFAKWLGDNHEHVMDMIDQSPRSLNSWAADYARTVKSELIELSEKNPLRVSAGAFAGRLREAASELGPDSGFAGIFGGSGDVMGLHDPEAEDEENW